MDFGLLRWLANKLIEWSYKPDLRIGELTVHGSNDHVGRHSMKVHNDGGTAAKNVIGKITIEGINPDENISNPSDKEAFINSSSGYRPIEEENLCWSFSGKENKNPPTISIYPEDHRKLDVAHIMENEKIRIPSESGWETIRVELESGTYRGEIKVKAENVIYQAHKHSRKFNIENNNGQLEMSWVDD